MEIKPCTWSMCSIKFRLSLSIILLIFTKTLGLVDYPCMDSDIHMYMDSQQGPVLYMFAPGCFTFDYKIKYRGYNFLNQIYLCLYFIHFHKKSYVKFYSIFISDLKLKKKLSFLLLAPLLIPFDTLFL